MLTAAITIQISAIKTAAQLPGWSTAAVAPMAIPIDPRASTTAPNPTRPGTGSRRGRRRNGGSGYPAGPYSRASTRLSISSPMRSTRPSATAVS